MNEEENHIPQQPEKKSKDRTALFIGLIVALLGVIVFFYYTNKNLKDQKADQSEELSKTLLQLDSISNELEMKIITISELGGEIDTLIQLKAALQTERRLLLTEVKNRKQMISTLKGRVDGYQELLLAKDEEIEQLRKVNEQLMSENTELKTEQEQLHESIEEINKAKDELAEKVAFAGRLKVEGLKVFAINENGKERASEFRNRHIHQLKVTFTIGENKVAPIEGKALLIRIVAPDGNVLFDVTRGSGSFIFEGREMFYSAKQEILYDRNSQAVSLLYEKGSEYATGKHQVEVYTEDYLMGKGAFTIK